MTERKQSALQRDRTSLTIGPSNLSWDGTRLTIRLNETGAPLPRPIRGTIRVTPHIRTDQSFVLDATGRHRWWPIAPRARVDVALDKPACRWTGHGYFDTNTGSEPLEEAFIEWNWSRGDFRDGAVILYDALRMGADRQTLALRVDSSGRIEAFEPPPTVSLPKGVWRVGRSTLADPDGQASIVKPLVDSPFYTRSVIRSTLLGEPVTAIHESLDLTRFSQFWVRCMLPFRMPRIPW